MNGKIIKTKHISEFLGGTKTEGVFTDGTTSTPYVEVNIPFKGLWLGSKTPVMDYLDNKYNNKEKLNETR